MLRCVRRADSPAPGRPGTGRHRLPVVHQSKGGRRRCSRRDPSGRGRRLRHDWIGGDPRSAPGLDMTARFGSLSARRGKRRLLADRRWRPTDSISTPAAALDPNPCGLLAQPGAESSPMPAPMPFSSGRRRRDHHDCRIPLASAAGDRCSADQCGLRTGRCVLRSELTGAPFTPGAANIYRVVAGQAPEVYSSGFRTAIDLAFAPDGSLYVLELPAEPRQSLPVKATSFASPRTARELSSWTTSRIRRRSLSAPTALCT